MTPYVTGRIEIAYFSKRFVEKIPFRTTFQCIFSHCSKSIWYLFSSRNIFSPSRRERVEETVMSAKVQVAQLNNGSPQGCIVYLDLRPGEPFKVVQHEGEPRNRVRIVSLNGSGESMWLYMTDMVYPPAN